jgi:hypothetical protein
MLRTVYLGSGYGGGFMSMNSHGHVAFQRGGNLLLAGEGAPEIVVNRKDFPAGLDSSYTKVFLSDDGQIGAVTAAYVHSAESTAVLQATESGLRTWLRPGQQASNEEPDVVFSAHGGYWLAYRASFNRNGDAVLVANLEGPGVHRGNNKGLWTTITGSLTTVVREGDLAPGTGEGWVFLDINPNAGYAPPINDRGQTAFYAYIGHVTQNEPYYDLSVWHTGGNGLQLIAKSGDPVPGMSTTNVWHQVRDPVLNNAGQVAFWGSWNSGRDSGAFVTQESAARPVIVSGDTLANSPTETIGYVWDFAINGNGAVVAKAFLTDADLDLERSGIVSSTSGTIRSVARDGEQVPGMESGVQFKELLNTSEIAVNRAGQVAIYAQYTGDPMGPYPSGIWAQDNGGVLRLIVHNGQELEVAPGDRRTINYIWTYGEDSGLEDGRQSWFNEAGQVLFGARFTDQSEGIFVSNAVAIPEHSTIVLAIVGFTALCVAVRRLHLGH